MLLCAASRPGWLQKNTLKIHFRGASVQTPTPLRMSYGCRSLSEKCSAFFLVRGLAAHTSAFSELKHSPGLHWWSISCLVAQTKAYCFVANLMACGKGCKARPRRQRQRLSGRRGGGRAQSLLSVMMTPNEGMGCRGVLSGIISLDWNEKDGGSWSRQWKTTALSHCPCEFGRLIIAGGVRILSNASG